MEEEPFHTIMRYGFLGLGAHFSCSTGLGIRKTSIEFYLCYFFSFVASHSNLVSLCLFLSL